MTAGATPVRLLVLALAGAVVLAGAWLWSGHRDDQRADEQADDHPHAEVLSAPATSGWKTIEYRGVQVDIPASWEPLNMDDCEFQFEVWTPPEVDGCAWTGGVAFYGSATFDPAHGPGVRRVERRGEPGWGGYTHVGDYAVYASTDDRAVVERMLQSAH